MILSYEIPDINKHEQINPLEEDCSTKNKGRDSYNFKHHQTPLRAKM
jgi:hypothetical protein